MKQVKPWIVGVILLILVLVGASWIYQSNKAISSKNISSQTGQAPLKSAQTETVLTPPAVESTPVALPAEVNIDVPFTPQAPYANWDAVHEETCEEASILMAQWFVQKKSGRKQGSYNNLIPADVAESQLQDLVAWQRETFGYFEDTTAVETTRILTEKLGVTARLQADPSADDIRRELASGNIVIAPAAGQLLKNPYFKAPGPPYHMFVIRGYNSQGFIVNDPGTKRGENFVYSEVNLMESIHDWTGSDTTVVNGHKIVIVVEP